MGQIAVIVLWSPVMLMSGMLLAGAVCGLCFLLWSVLQATECTLLSAEVAYMAVLVGLACCLLPGCAHFWWSYVLIEVLSLCSYGLVYNGVACEYSAEAAVKYYVLGSVSSLLFLASGLVLHAGLGLMSMVHLLVFPVGT